MSNLRYVKTQEQLIEAAENNLEFFDAKMHAIKAWYKTEPGLIENLYRPLYLFTLIQW